MIRKEDVLFQRLAGQTDDYSDTDDLCKLPVDRCSSTSDLCLTDLEVDDLVYSDSDFDDCVFQDTSRRWRNVLGVMTSSRKDSALGCSEGNSSADCSEQELCAGYNCESEAVSPRSNSSPLPAILSPVTSRWARVDVNVSKVAGQITNLHLGGTAASKVRRPVPRMGTRVQRCTSGATEDSRLLGSKCEKSRPLRVNSDTSAYQTGCDSCCSSPTSPKSPHNDSLELVSPIHETLVPSAASVSSRNEKPSQTPTVVDGVEMEWVVRIRSDGSRYIARRPINRRHSRRRRQRSDVRQQRRRHRTQQQQHDVTANAVKLWRQKALRAIKGDALDTFVTVEELMTLGDTVGRIGCRTYEPFLSVTAV